MAERLLSAVLLTDKSLTTVKAQHRRSISTAGQPLFRLLITRVWVLRRQSLASVVAREV